MLKAQLHLAGLQIIYTFSSDRPSYSFWSKKNSRETYDVIDCAVDNNPLRWVNLSA